FPEWGNIKSIIKVYREREYFKMKKRVVEKETSYYVSNSQFSAAEFGLFIRRQWFIENKDHHIRDTTFREDCSPKRVNPSVFAILLSTALNIMRAGEEENIRGSTINNAFNIMKMIKKFSVFLR